MNNKGILYAACRNDLYGMFSKEDILTRLFQRENRKPLADIEIDTSITNRDYQLKQLKMQKYTTIQLNL